MNFSYPLGQHSSVLIGVFLLLAVMSVSSWYIIFWKSWEIMRERRIINNFRKHHSISGSALPSGANGSIAILIKEAERLKPMFSLSDAKGNEKLLTLYLAQALDNIRAHYERGLVILASIGSSATFIGLFGTVWGVYLTLISVAEAGSAGLSAVAGPMGKALIATTAGLFAAVPAVLAYNGFVRLNRVLLQDLRHIAEQIVFHLTSTKDK